MKPPFTHTHNDNNMEAESFESKKKIKLRCNITLCCSICNTNMNRTHNVSETNIICKIYGKLLIRYLMPTIPSKCPYIKLKEFRFCQRCIIILEELKNLEEVLENTRKMINKRLTKIKQSILTSKSGKAKADSFIATFREVAVKDFQPFVKLTKLKSPFLETKLKKQCKTARKKIRQPPKAPQVPFSDIKTEEVELNLEGASCKIEVQDETFFSDGSVKPEIVTCIPQIKEFDFLEDIVQFEPWNEVDQSLSLDPLTENNDISNIDRSNDYSIDTNNDINESRNSSSDMLQIRQTNPVQVQRIWSKPPLTMTQFAILAIKNGPNGGMLVHDIMNFISENFPYYRSAENWKFLLRNALSCNSCFVRIAESDLNHSSMAASMSGRWTLDEERITDAFKMKIVELCVERYVAHPELLNDMLQALTANHTFVNGSNEISMSSSYLERQEQIYTETMETEKTTIPNSIGNGITVPLNENMVTNQIQCWNGNEESNAVDQYLVPSSETLSEKQWVKPKLKDIFLAFVAIMNLPEQEGTIRNIFDFIKENYPYFKGQNLDASLYSTMLKSRYFKANPVNYDSLSVKWTVNYDHIKFMLTIIADSVRDDASGDCMAYPERLNDILRPLFANALSYDHLFFVTLKATAQETLSAEEICEFVVTNFLPFICYQDGLSSQSYRSKIMERLYYSLFFQLNANNMKWSIVDATKERTKKEIIYIITTSPGTILNAVTKPELITYFIRAVS